MKWVLGINRFYISAVSDTNRRWLFAFWLLINILRNWVKENKITTTTTEHLQSSGCCVVEKHPSADIYNRSAPPGGNSLKPLLRNTNNWLIDGLYSRYLCGLSRNWPPDRFSPFSRNPLVKWSLYGIFVAGLESCGTDTGAVDDIQPCMPVGCMCVVSLGSRSSVCSIRNMSMVSSENAANTLRERQEWNQQVLHFELFSYSTLVY